MSARVLLVDDDEDIRLSLQQSLELRGFDVAAFARADRALDRVAPDFPGVIVSDIRMPGMDGLDLLARVRALDDAQPVILVTGHGDVPLAVEAMARGAFDFIEKPFAIDRLVGAIERAAETRRVTVGLRHAAAAPATEDPLAAVIVGRAPAMVDLRRRLRAVAETDLDVLIAGATGTGKELVARAIHRLSRRRDRPFVTINLAALPAAGVEAELFGHTAGAFAGAMRARTGRLEHARGGIVHLDQIESAPLALQVKLLRMIEDRAIEPLGTSDPVPLDVRFVASTKNDLAAMSEAGTFRDDLYYRLSPVTLSLPPLADRAEDIPLLYRHFLAEAAARFGRTEVAVPPARLVELAAAPWRGNLRELRHDAERQALGIDAAPLSSGDAPDATLAERVDAFERGIIGAALAAHDGNLRATYESLGLSRKTLYEKMQKHGLKRDGLDA